jgi:hypothetical protein
VVLKPRVEASCSANSHLSAWNPCGLLKQSSRTHTCSDGSEGWQSGFSILAWWNLGLRKVQSSDFDWRRVVWAVGSVENRGRADDLELSETLDEPLDDACDIARVHSAAPANPPLCRVPLSPLFYRWAGGRCWQQQRAANIRGGQ